MKRVFLFAVVALVMSATCFAGNKEKKSNEWTVSVNASTLGKYLELSDDQYGEVRAISDFFNTKMKSAANSKASKQGECVREAVYGNFKLMKNTLNDEQYRKYLRVMNITLKNKGLDVYLNE